MYIVYLNQYAIELVTYLLVLVVNFYEFIVYMLLERNAFGSIEFCSECSDPIRVMVERLMNDMHIQTHRDELKVLSSNSKICLI